MKDIHQRDRSLRYPCNICGKEYRNEKQLNIHLIRHIKPSNKIKTKNMCYYCKGKYFRRIDLDSHLREMHAEETRQDYIECNACLKLYRRKSLMASFEAHTASCDPDKKQSEKTCIQCNLVFKRRSGLKVHQEQRKCISKPKEPLICTKCDKTFRTKELVGKHKDIVHGAKSVVCPDCGESYHPYYRAKHHQSLVHRGVPPRKGLSSIPMEGSEGWGKVWGEVSRYTSSTRRAGEGVRREAWARLRKVLPGLDRPLRYTKGGLQVAEVLTEVEVEEVVGKARVTREQMEVVLGVVAERLGLDV